MSKRSKYVIFYFKATESDGSDLDDEDIAVINKKLRKLLKKGGNYEKKFPSSKKKNLTLLCMLLGNRFRQLN